MFFLIKICNLLIHRPPLRTSKLQETPSSLNRPLGSGSVFPMRIRIKPTKMNADPCGSGSATLSKTIEKSSTSAQAVLQIRIWDPSK
jgi:hypothetical protein